MKARCLAAVVLVLGIAGPSTAETRTGAPADWPPPMADMGPQSLFIADQLEFRSNDGDDLLRWEIEAWLGGDTHKAWLKTEGEWRTSGPAGGDLEVQLLYARLIRPFWDFQIGVRQDLVFGSGRDLERTFAAIGVEGLAPLWFEVSPTLFVSDDGDISARLTATYDLLFTQRLVLQPRFELNVAVQDARRFGIRSGFNDIELGARLRYEIRREIAPYIGVNWIRKLGGTAALARDEGDEAGVFGWVAGLRFWF